jgi:hypothetical protein
MKSYLFAFGKALVTSTAVHYLHRRRRRKIFNENGRHRKNYAFPVRIQALNYEIIKFLSARCQDGRILDLQLVFLTTGVGFLFCRCN